jgi:hypothetical protein
MTAHVERTGKSLQLCDQMRLLAERAYRSQCQWLERLHRGEQQIDAIEQRIDAATELHSSQYNLLIVRGRERAPMFDDGCEHRPIFMSVFRKGRFMGNRCLDSAIQHPIGNDLRGIGERHGNDLRAVRAKCRGRRGEHASSPIIDVIRIPGDVDADPKVLDAVAGRCQIIRHRVEQRRRIGWIAAGDCPQQQTCIDGAASNRTDVIQ